MPFVLSQNQVDSHTVCFLQGGHFQGLLLGLRSGASVVADIRAEGRWPDCGPGQPNPFPWIIPANKLPLIMQWCASVRVPSSFGVRLEAILRTEADGNRLTHDTMTILVDPLIYVWSHPSCLIKSYKKCKQH